MNWYEAGLLYEPMRTMYESMENVQAAMTVLFQILNEGHDGIYGFPTEVSTLHPDTSSEGLDPDTLVLTCAGICMEEQGYPEMGTLEDLLPDASTNARSQWDNRRW
ncbi:MAG: hypothetical protein ACLSIL_10940 [Enterococcus casseliflavus]